MNYGRSPNQMFVLPEYQGTSTVRSARLSNPLSGVRKAHLNELISE